MTNKEFEKVVKQYERLVFTICNQFVRDYHEAENLTQETFLSAFYHIDQCRVEDLKPWLARIASNKAKDHLKSAYVRKNQLTEEIREGDMKALEPSPESIYIEGESSTEVKEIIQSLKEPYVKVASLFFIEEKSIEEIANTLERPKKTVQTQLGRAKLILKQMIAKEVEP